MSNGRMDVFVIIRVVRNDDAGGLGTPGSSAASIDGTDDELLLEALSPPRMSGSEENSSVSGDSGHLFSLYATIVFSDCDF